MSGFYNQDTEVVFGLVSPVGTDDVRVIESLQQCLSSTGYTSKVIRVSKFLEQTEGLDTAFSKSNQYERIDTLMSRGDEIRSKLDFADALAGSSILGIQTFRQTINENKSRQQPLHRHAYIIKSLKHPKEVSLLRQVYGKSFWLISVYSPENERRTFLSRRINESGYTLENPSAKADLLINRDQKESNSYGQNVRQAFPLGDVFIDASLDSLDKSMDRFVKIVFGYPYHTPTIDEYGMYLAQASALMSSSLARQVGASIMNEKGSVFATGTNEVPHMEGGVCNENVGSKFREFEKGFDSNTKYKEQLLGNFLQLLKDEKWFADSKQKDVDELIKDVFKNPKLNSAQLMNVTEFGREVHAEMTALIEAARKTLSVEDCLLYCTTFPCHVCAKHIIASKLKKVVFIEPYHKSLADELFDDFIDVDKKSTVDKKIQFNPFVGIAPRRYIDIFKWITRKDDDGNPIKWEQIKSHPRLGEEPPAIAKKEDDVVTILLKKIEEKKLNFIWDLKNTIT